MQESLILWLKPRVGYTESTGTLDFSPVRRIRPFYGNSADQDKQIRQRQYAQSELGSGSSGSSDSPIYLYGSGGSNARRVCSNDIVAIMRRDERLAGYADVQGVIDCHKKIIAIKIRSKDVQGSIHGGFIHVHSPKQPRLYYLPDKLINVHLSHLRFMHRPNPSSTSTSSAATTSSSSTFRNVHSTSAPSLLPKTPPEDLQRYIRHHLSSRTSEMVSTSRANNSDNYRRRTSNLPTPKYGFTSPLVRRHNRKPNFWSQRAAEISLENRYKDAILERKNNDWGAPLKCVCGRWQHDCHDANCVYERAKILGTNVTPKMPYEMPYDRARKNEGTTKETRREARREQWQRKIYERQHILPETTSSLDSDLLERISRLSLDAGSPKRTMPNVDKEAYRAEQRAFDRLNLLDKDQAIKEEDEDDWVCGVCQASNPSITPLCSICGRKKGRDLDTKNVQTKFMKRMLVGMKKGKSLDFDGREEKEAARKRRQERIMERQTIVAVKKQQIEQKERVRVERNVKSDSDTDDDDPEDDDKRGIAGVVQRQTRKVANMYTWNNLQQKTGVANTIKFLAGTDFTDAVGNAEIEDLKAGKKIEYGENSLKALYKNQVSSYGGEMSNSSGGSDSDSDSDSSSSSSDDDEEE